MQAKVGHGEEEEGGVGDYSNALLGARHQPLHELQTPCLDLLLLFSEVWAPQLVLFCFDLQVATLIGNRGTASLSCTWLSLLTAAPRRSCNSRVMS